jgi:pullulanase/glycogen debranching enzyme
VPKCVVVDPAFDWVDDVALPTPLHASVIYELHVKGFSMLNTAVPAPLRGTYWITEMHVDGFRFDLAASLACGESGVSKFAAFFEIIHQDPVISQVKLIAEPWDGGEGGYQVGNFPVLTTMDLWRGGFRPSWSRVQTMRPVRPPLSQPMSARRHRASLCCPQLPH